MTYKYVYGDDTILVSAMDIHGGQTLQVSMNSMYKEQLRWLQSFKMEYEAEKQLRESNPAVKNAWEQYQVVKALANKETQA